MKGKRKSLAEVEVLIKSVEDLRAKGMTATRAMQEVGVDSATYYTWRKKVAQPESAREVVQMPRNGSNAELKQLKVENSRLKVIVANQALDIQALHEYYGTK